MKSPVILLLSVLALPLAAEAHETTPYRYAAGHYDRRDCDDRDSRHGYHRETHDWRYHPAPWAGWRVPYYRPYAWAPPAHWWDRRDDRDNDRAHDWHGDRW